MNVGMDLDIEHGEHDSIVISFNAPQRRNSLRNADVTALADALSGWPDRVAVLRSRTPGMFCSGADLRIDDAERRAVSDNLYALYESMITRPGVVFAVVDGPAVGGGAQLSMAADLRVITARAAWRWLGPGHGLAVGAWILPTLIGRGRAMSLMLTQRWMTAAEAEQCGLAPALTDTPDGAQRDLVNHLAQLDRSAVARVKQITSTPELLATLREERAHNASAWSGAGPLHTDHSPSSFDIPNFTPLGGCSHGTEPDRQERIRDRSQQGHRP